MPHLEAHRITPQRALGSSSPCASGVLLWLLALVALAACRDVNRDHCLHRAEDPDAWCAKNAPEAPFCSPCALENHGCVAAAPDPADCPAYEPDADPDTTGA